MNARQKKAGGCLKTFIITSVVLLSFIILTGILISLYYINTLPTLEDLTPSPVAQTSKVFAIDGRLITEFHAEENREIIQFKDMSPNIINAVVAVEDKRFFEHQGVDYIRIIGAFIADIRAGEWAQGASTITQQYVKNIYFTPEKTFRRKLNEALIAIQLERNYTKNKIIEMYLNTINFGSSAYGIEKASQIYLGVNAGELNLPQAALLAGLIRSPETYSPFNDKEKAKSRRDLVLELMHEQELITDEEYLDAISTPVEINQNLEAISDQPESRIAPYFVDYVKRNLYDNKFTDYDVFKGGLRIYTTLDIDLQEKAENAFKKVFPEDIEPSYSLVSTDPQNGYVYALIGGKDYNKSKFNIAIQGKRQPGSVFKVPVLIESIRQRLSSNTVFNPNGPITIDMEEGPDWNVDNYGSQKFDTDKMTIADATVHSVNVVYSQLIMKVGAENVEKLLNQMEINDIGSNPAIALGGLETGITPLDLSKIFSTLASGGLYNNPVSILKIEDSRGNIIYEYEPGDNESNKRIIESSEAYYATQILKKVVESGTGKRASIGRPCAGKTGTTESYNDAWFAGYTPELVTVVWMGYPDSNKPLVINGVNVAGGSYPADIWREFMSYALESFPVSNFKEPDEKLIDVEVCTESNLIPSFWCPEETIGWKIFLESAQPEEICNIHNKVKVPDVIGLNKEEAIKIFENLYFVVTEVEDFNDIYNKGIIFKQDPESDTLLESFEGEKLSITLYVSKGKKTFKMPDLTGMILNDAIKVIESLELLLTETEYEYDDIQPENFIIKQVPVPDSMVTKSTPVTLYLSKGENPQSEVPDVSGLTEEEALAIFNEAGFENITVLYKESEEEIDKVFSQTPVSGTIYDKMLEIIIKISLGIEMPDVTGVMKTDAITALEELGFIVEISPDSAEEGEVVSQIPEAGEYLEYGSTVIIEIN
jgi:penicillin-binding protein 1A